MNTNTEKGFELILKQFGNFSRYNICTYCLLLVVVYFYGLHQNVFVFIGPDIKYRCNISECENVGDETQWLEYAIPSDKGEFSKCKKYSKKETNTSLHNNTCKPEMFDNATEIVCDSFVYSNEDSIVKDFNLACQEWKRTLLGTVHFAGNIIMLPVIGIASDRYGRKLTLVASVVILGATCVIKSFSFNFETILVLEFLSSGLTLGLFNTAFVFAMELVQPRERVLAGTVMDFACNLGHLTFTGLAWLLQNWRYLLRVLGAPTLLFIFYFWLIDESARWLLSKGRNEQAFKVVKKAAKINKIDISHDVMSLLREPKCPKNVSYKENNTTLIVAIKSNVIRKRLLVCSFLYITCNFVYYGLTINAVSLSGNKYLNLVYVSLAEIVASFVCWLILDKFGRKKTLMTAYLLSGLFCISLIFLTKDLRNWSIYSYLLGMLWICVAYISLNTFLVELFPTSFRQSMISTCGLFGRIASILSASTPLLALSNEYLLAVIFGSLPLLSALMIFTLPETSKVNLPETIKDAEKTKEASIYDRSD